MKDLFTLLWAKRWKIAAGVFVLLLIDAAQMVVPLILRRAIDELASNQATSNDLLKYALAIMLIGLFVFVFRFFWRYFIMGAARENERDLRQRIYAHVLRLHQDFFSHARTGDVMALATNDAEAVRMALGMGVVASSDAIIMGGFSLAAMLWVSPSLTVYTLIPLVLTMVVVMFFGKMLFRRFKAVQESFAEITERVREAISGITIIKAFVQDQGEAQAYRQLNQEYIAKNMSLIKVWGLFWPMVSFFAGSATALVIWQGGIKAVVGEISLGDIVAFISYLGIMVWPMIAIGWVTNLLQRGAASMGRINQLLNTKPLIIQVENPWPGPVKGRVEARELSFRYSPDGPLVLDRVDLEIEQGSSLGIVGRTGSGKTTLVSLMLRLYDPPDQSLFIDRVDVKKWDIHRLRQDIGFVPQEAFLFSTTIRENIAFFNPDAPEEEVINAAKVAMIWDEIQDMPQGLDTVVGERGITLSGGQKQRVALARALIKDPKILILDDTLSAVDAETEEKILENLKEFIPGRTSVIISHRLSAVRHADNIIVLDDGKIVEQGDHQSLLQVKGLYWRTWQLQQMERQTSV